MRRSASAAVLALVPVLAACGGGAPDTPATTARTGAPDASASVTAPAAPPADPELRPDPDPCRATPAERRRRGLGPCVLTTADGVARRGATLRLSGMSATLRDVRFAPRVTVGGVPRRAGADEEFVVARLFLRNRRSTPVVLDRGALSLNISTAYGEAEVWTTPAVGGGIGPEHSELRLRPGAAGTVVAVYRRGRFQRSQYPDATRLVLAIPDPPGTPPRGPGGTPGITIRQGVLLMTR